MTWYSDFSSCDYFPLEDTSKLQAIGWLANGHGISQGKVESEFLLRLAELARRPWQPIFFLGEHDCELCPGEGPDSVVVDGDQVAVGATNVFVPHASGVFVAPSLILHYIIDHGYRPPDEFVRAVLDCPPMGTEAYLDAVRAASGEGVMLPRKRDFSTT